MKTFIHLLFVLVALLAAGCSNDKATQDVMQPIRELITGKWQMYGFSTFEDGKWVEQVNDNNVSMAMDFRPDGTEVRVMTYPDGFTALASRTWSVDDANRQLTDGGTQLKIYRLSADELVLESTQSMNPGTGEIREMKCRWTYRRATENDKTLAERLVGKWRFTGAYEKVEGQWVEREEDRFDEFWLAFNEDGSSEEHAFRNNEEFQNTKSKWSANTSSMLIRTDDSKEDRKIGMPDDNTLVYYFESDNGEVILKDVYVRESKSNF